MNQFVPEEYFKNSKSFPFEKIIEFVEADDYEFLEKGLEDWNPKEDSLLDLICFLNELGYQMISKKIVERTSFKSDIDITILFELLDKYSADIRNMRKVIDLGEKRKLIFSMKDLQNSGSQLPYEINSNTNLRLLKFAYDKMKKDEGKKSSNSSPNSVKKQKNNHVLE
jgi:hypothetical protein